MSLKDKLYEDILRIMCSCSNKNKIKTMPASPYWTDDINPGKQPDGTFSKEMNKEFIDILNNK